MTALDRPALSHADIATLEAASRTTHEASPGVIASSGRTRSVEPVLGRRRRPRRRGPSRGRTCAWERVGPAASAVRANVSMHLAGPSRVRSPGITSRRTALRSRSVSSFVGSTPRAEVQRPAERLDLVPRHVEQRADHGRRLVRPDPAHPVRSPPADEADEHRLRLVVHACGRRPPASRRSRRQTSLAARIRSLASPTSPSTHRGRASSDAPGDVTVEPVPRGEAPHVRGIGSASPGRSPWSMWNTESRSSNRRRSAGRATRAGRPSRDRRTPRRARGRPARTCRARGRSP